VYEMAGPWDRSAQPVGIGLGALGPVRRFDGMDVEVTGRIRCRKALADFFVTTARPWEAGM